MKVAIQAEYPPSGQIAFFSGLQQANRRLGTPLQILPLSLPQESIVQHPQLLDQIDAYAGSLIGEEWIAPHRNRVAQWIDLAQWSGLNETPSIGVDYEKIGAAAAQALAEHGALHGFLIAPETQARSRRLLAEARAATDIPFDTIPLLTRERLRETIAKLVPKSGIITLSDRAARFVCELARDLGRTLGEDLKVIGLGDEPEASMLAGVGIASFPIPYAEIGKAVVEGILHCRKESQLLAPGPLQVRESLAVRTGEPDTIGRIIAWMNAHLAANASLEDVARMHGMSRRTMELKFKQADRQSPNREWNALRIKQAKGLLVETDLRIVEIAERCGYSSQSRFTQAFTASTGSAQTVFRSG